MSEPRTEMKCLRCGGFSSVAVCWHCSNLPDAVMYADMRRLQLQIGAYRHALHELARWKLKDGDCWCDGGERHSPGCQAAREAMQ